MAEMIDQGGFGCIFYPGLNCKSDFTKKSKKIVSKLQHNTFNARNEILIGSKIKEIKEYTAY